MVADNVGRASIESVANLAGRLERLPFSSYQRAIFAVVATAWLFDSIDLGAMTFLLGPIKAEFKLDGLSAGILASSSFLGMFFGAALSGMLADSFGRKVIFQFSMLVWGVGSLLCAFSGSFASLLVFRIVVGFGMGMEFPVAQAIASEITPSSHRGRYIAMLEGFWPIGLILSGLIAITVLSHHSWRAVFFIEGLPAVFLFILRRIVPESPRWLLEVGRADDAERVMSNMERRVSEATGKPLPPIPDVHITAPDTHVSFPFAELWSSAYRRRTAVLWALWFLSLLGFYGITTWLGALLQAKGFSMAKSNWYIVGITLAGIPGFFTAALTLDSVGRKPVLVTALLGGGLFAYLYGSSGSVEALIIFGCLMQFFLFAMWSALYTYTPELYPTRARATGTGWASAIGRLGSLIGPILVGVMLPVYGQTGVFIMGTASLAAAAALVLLFGVETKGEIIEKISA